MINIKDMGLDELFVHTGETSAEFDGYIDTGCYMLNAAISGSIFGGLPNNKAICLAGESTTGKTFIALDIVRQFLASNPKAVVVYFDTESAVSKEMMDSRGVDTSRVIMSEPETIEDFRFRVLKFIEKYNDLKPSVRDSSPILMVLDSLGQLSTNKEVRDTGEGKDTRDMTRAGLIKGTFRTIRLKLAKAKIPLIITNHTYDQVGAMFPTKELSGGSGIKYSADIIVMLSKSKDKDQSSGEVKGNIINVKMFKARQSRENKIVKLLLSYDTGLNQHYGLLPYAEQTGAVKKVSTRYEIVASGMKLFESQVYKPEQAKTIFTDDVLKGIDELVKKEFTYGSAETEETGETD